jgi:hypothetical protein
MDRKEAARKALPRGAFCTFFPMEQQWAVFIGPRMIGGMEDTVEAACYLAIDILKEEANGNA